MGGEGNLEENNEENLPEPKCPVCPVLPEMDAFTKMKFNAFGRNLKRLMCEYTNERRPSYISSIANAIGSDTIIQEVKDTFKNVSMIIDCLLGNNKGVFAEGKKFERSQEEILYAKIVDLVKQGANRFFPNHKMAVVDTVADTIFTHKCGFSAKEFKELLEACGLEELGELKYPAYFTQFKEPEDEEEVVENIHVVRDDEAVEKI